MTQNIIGDPKADPRSRTSDALWDGYTTIEKWRDFVKHDFPHPSRGVAWRLVKEYVVQKAWEGNPLTFAEIGFGGAYDFKMCFKQLHDLGAMTYTGFDHTAYFVDYAKQDYPNYDWRVGEFVDLKPQEFDVTYTRHVLQHQSPETYEGCIGAMLDGTRKVAIVVWHPPLGEEHIHFEHGGYCNTFDKETVDALIRGRGFKITEVPADEDVVYWMERL